MPKHQVIAEYKASRVKIVRVPCKNGESIIRIDIRPMAPSPKKRKKEPKAVYYMGE